MKSYQTIPKIPTPGLLCYVFAKYDGSMIRAEWDAKKGFHKWGRRNGLLDDSNPILKRAPEIFESQKMGVALEDALKSFKCTSATLYFEFWGKNSFAGNHSEDEQQTLTLFDVDVRHQGLIMPDTFMKYFGHLAFSQKLLYMGNWTKELENSIIDSTLVGIPFEGVIAKAKPKSPKRPVIMWKFKTSAWLDKLKNRCGDDKRLFDLLA